MRLKRNFRVVEVKPQLNVDDPFVMILRSDPDSRDADEIRMVMDDAAMKRLSFKETLHPVSRHLEMEFESRSNENAPEQDSTRLEIVSLMHVKSRVLCRDPKQNDGLPYWIHSIEQPLVLSTLSTNPNACPKYFFELDLTEQEYIEAEKLPADSHFIIASMRLITKPS